MPSKASAYTAEEMKILNYLRNRATAARSSGSGGASRKDTRPAFPQRLIGALGKAIGA